MFSDVSIFVLWVFEWSITKHIESAVFSSDVESVPFNKICDSGVYLSWLEHLPYKERVGGSSPSTPTRSHQAFAHQKFGDVLMWRTEFASCELSLSFHKELKQAVEKLLGM